MKVNPIFRKLILFSGMIMTCLFFLTKSTYASGGKIFDYEKVGPVVAGSYTLIAPVGNFANSGRGGTGYAKWGQGFELEGLYYWNIDYNDHFRLGIGETIPFYFLPVNGSTLDPELHNAFAQAPYSHTSFIPPEHNQWFAWGFGTEISGLYAAERFSIEATVKFGYMSVYAPQYRLQGGSYVPPSFTQYFPYEGGGGLHGSGVFGNFGLQCNVFL